MESTYVYERGFDSITHLTTDASGRNELHLNDTKIWYDYMVSLGTQVVPTIKHFKTYKERIILYNQAKTSAYF